MKSFVIVLLIVLAQLANAQVTQLPDQLLYRGADYSFSMVLTRPDSSLSSTATLFFGQSAGPLKPPLQPTVTRSGRTLTLAWSAAQTGEMIDGKYWLEIKAGLSVRFAAWVYASKNPTHTTPPGTLTVISPIAESGPTSFFERPYSLSNVGPSGHRITHNKATELVSGTFFRQDTKQADPLWRIEIVDANNVDVVGPPGETFTGYVVLKPIPLSNQ